VATDNFGHSTFRTLWRNYDSKFTTIDFLQLEAALMERSQFSHDDADSASAGAGVVSWRVV